MSRRIRLMALAMVLVLAVGAITSLSPMSARAASVADLQQKLADLAKEENALKNKLASCKNDVAKQQEYADSLKAKMKNSEQQIELLRQQAELVDADIADTDAKIAQKEADVRQKQADIDARFALFGERLRSISQTGNLTALQMVFQTDNYVDYLLKTKVISRIADNDQRLMDELTEQVEGLNAEKATLATDKSALQQKRQEVAALKATADEKKWELETLYKECNDVLKKLQASVNSVNDELKKKAQEEAALDAEIRKLLAELAKPKPDNNGSGSSGGSRDKYSGGTMVWPVPAVHNISSPFGMRDGRLHRGVDIANGSVPVYGQDIVAAADGTVVFVNKTSTYGGGYGYYTMINHGEDSQGRQIVTLYAHCSAILVNKDDRVVAGQTIAKAGNTGNITGPHLHFEVRVDGTAVNPITNGYLKMN